MQFITQLGFTSVLATWLSLSALSAQTETATTNNEPAAAQLPEYIVSANTYPVPSNEVGSTVHTLSREDLELGQTTFVLDALRELPGVSVRNYGGPGNGFGISTRGLNDAPVMLIDGIEVNNPAGNILNPGTLFTNNIERIEFLKGGQSTLYGADALAGVISVETRKVQDGQTKFSLNSSIGSFNTKMGSFGVRSQRGPLDFSANISRQTSDGFSAQPTNNENDAYNNTSIQAKVGYELTDTITVFTSIYYIDAFSQSDANLIYYPDAEPDYGYDDIENLYITSGTKIQLNDAWYSQFSYAYSRIRSPSYYDTGKTKKVWKSNGDRHKLSWANTINLSERWDLAAGVQYEFEDNRADAGDRDEMSYYADNTFEVTPDLFITLGGRFDDNSVYGQNETWRSSFSYNISAINARLHGSYGSTFKAPNFLQLYDPKHGNPDLKAQQGVAWDFGIEQHLLDDRLVCDVTLFGNDLKEKIDWNRKKEKHENTPSYQSYGLESSVRWIASEKLILQANYSFTRAENGTSTVTPFQMPKHLFNLSANWSTLAGRLQLKPSIQHVAARNDYYGALPSHTLLNLAGQYALNPQVTVWTRVNNLLDKDYQEYNGYNSADFNITTGVKVEF